jgi:hypothetical protein
MTAQEFKAFAKIERLNQNITITEKIHGTNAQILIQDGKAQAGSRNRWITPEDDNFGFARWVSENETALVEALGEGRHFGEWYGLGINAGYGLNDRRFVLFDTYRYASVELPANVQLVPILYSGPYSASILEAVFETLREKGSTLVPGYMKPEGFVVRWDRTGVLMKRTFESEDTEWSYKKERPERKDTSEIDALCAPYWQPLRLEKILSMDERFVRDYPTNLPALVSSYIADLKNEEAIPEEMIKVVKKNAFKAIKGMMAERGFSA